MSYEISKNNNNDKRNLDDLAWIEELYNFLQGKELPDGFSVGKSSQPKLSEKKAYTIIWLLQEHLRVLPDHIERCDCCGDLYDSYQCGLYVEKPFKRMHHFCDGCADNVPEKYWRD